MEESEILYSASPAHVVVTTYAIKIVPENSNDYKFFVIRNGKFEEIDDKERCASIKKNGVLK